MKRFMPLSGEQGSRQRAAGDPLHEVICARAMADARVDKAWIAKGLQDYPTEAILGTLKHYGAETDEATFKKLAQDKFPIGIAEEWHKSWKGTGQFSKFPAAAAEE